MSYSKIFFIAFSVLSSIAQAVELKDALVSAEKVDPDLAKALAEKTASQENITMSRARYLPQISAQGTYQQVDQSVERQTASGVPSTADYRVKATNSQVNLRQALIRPRDFLGMRVGQLQADYAMYKVVSAYNNLWQKVISAWLDAIAAKELYDTYHQSESAIRHASEQAKKSYKAGIGTKQAYAEAEAQLAYAQSNTIDAKLNLDSRLRVLIALVGNKEVNIHNKRLPAYSNLILPAKRQEDFLIKVMDASPEIMSAKTIEALRTVQYKQAYSDHLPTIDLVSSYTKSNNDNINQINTKVASTSVGVQISIPIFSGGYVQSAVRQAGAVANAAEAERMSIEKNISNQIDVDWASQDGVRGKIAAALSLANASKEQIRAAQLGVKVGVTSWLDIGNAYITWSRRQADYILITVSGVKTQLKLLSNIPIADDYWIYWVDQLNQQSSVSIAR